MSSEAHNRASAAYNKRHDNIMIRPTKEHGAKIRAAAAAAGQSVQRYVLDAIDARMEAEQQKDVANQRQICYTECDSGKGG